MLAHLNYWMQNCFIHRFILFECVVLLPIHFLCHFILKVDNLLGKRGRPGDNDEMHKMKNEITVNWDSLPTKELKRVIMIKPFNFLGIT
jgi:hypothetical protein